MDCVCVCCILTHTLTDREAVSGARVRAGPGATRTTTTLLAGKVAPESICWRLIVSPVIDAAIRAVVLRGAASLFVRQNLRHLDGERICGFDGLASSVWSLTQKS